MAPQHRQIAADGPTRFARAVALLLSLGSAALAATLLAEAAARDGFSGWDGLRALLVFATTAWLAWGASLALIGLFGSRSTPPRPALEAPQPRTVIAVPICNEDPLTTFVRRPSRGYGGFRRSVGHPR